MEPSFVKLFENHNDLLLPHFRYNRHYVLYDESCALLAENVPAAKSPHNTKQRQLDVILISQYVQVKIISLVS